MADDRSFRFPTATGTVAVHDGALGIRSTPGRLLAGQRRRWRHGDRWDRAGLAFEVAGVAWAVVSLVGHATAVAAGNAGVAAGLSTVGYLILGVFLAARLGRRHVGEARIPRSAVDAVRLDRDAGTLTIEHDAAGRLRSVLRDDPVETTLSLPSAEAVREAEAVLRARDVEFDVAEDSDIETTYRATIREGVWFCERCRSQVSPVDAACPACGYAIRVTSVDEGGRSDDGDEGSSGGRADAYASRSSTNSPF
jgi:hypothetical protein